MNFVARVLSRLRTRRELAAARIWLAGLRAAYRSGNFSGHPEETLESIDNARSAVLRLEQVIDDAEAAAAREALYDFSARWYKTPSRTRPGPRTGRNWARSMRA